MNSFIAQISSPSPVVAPVPIPVVPQVDIYALIIVMVVNGLPRWLELIKQSREKHDRLLESVTKELSDRSIKCEVERLEIQTILQRQNQVQEQMMAKHAQQTEVLANSLQQTLQQTLQRMGN